MSLYDISRLSGTGAARALGRDLSSSGKAETRPASTPAPAPADRGIAVETGSRVSAGAAPLDADRVAQIRDALKEGSYPIVPAKITDAVIAARLMLSSGQ
jgi:negative regulator of flagellin synthesis FlgM